MLTGKDKGKTGEVLKVLKKQQRVGGRASTSWRATPSSRPRMPAASSAPSIRFTSPTWRMWDPKTNKATRVGVKTLKTGEKSLIARGSSEEIRRI